ncbi:MAG: PAS domain S-box protein [Planctomycetes bacterium]|nr:PAS domain S-box protein [Planctomycetota bacterium]
MPVIRNLSIKFKLILISLSTTGVVLVLTISILVVNEFLSLRRSLIKELIVQANIIGENCTAAVTFDDAEAASEILKALTYAPNILYAAIYTREGRLFAELRSGDLEGTFSPPIRQGEGYHIGIKSLDVFQDIVFYRENIGTIYIRSDLRQLYHPILWHFSIAGIVVFGSLGFAFLMLSRLQQAITKPIRLLRQSTNELSIGNFDTRAEIQAGDEIGDLAESFNMMAENLQNTTVSRDYVDNIINTMMDSLIVIRPDGKIKTVNQAVLTLLGYSKDELLGQSIEIILGEGNGHLYNKEDMKALNGTGVVGLIKRGSVDNLETTYIAKDGRIINVILSCSVMRDVERKVQGIVCVALDITDRKSIENQLKDSLREKEVLLQEIHHRVKNNMQAIISLLNIQSKDIDDPKSAQMFEESQNRIHSMVLVHEQIFRSRDLARIRLKEYIENLKDDLFRSYRIGGKKISFKMQIEDILLGIDTSIPCGLIINEILTNSIKYAFPGERRGEIKIDVHLINRDEIEMIVGDNGVGLPDNFNFRNSPGFGFKVLVDLVEYKLMGSIKLLQAEGTIFLIKFKEIRYKERI